MSIMIMSRLFKMNLGGCNRKLLAVRLADFADDDGRGIYPGIKRLAAETELSPRTIQRILGDFVEEGILIVVQEASGRPGQTTRYDYDLAKLFAYKPRQTGDSVSPVSSEEGVTQDAETGDSGDVDGCHGVTRTVIEPLTEPLEREGARKAHEDRSTISGTAEFQKRVQRFLSGDGYHEGEWPKWAKGTTIGYITRHFAALTEGDRKAAEANRDAFLVKCKGDGGAVMGAGNYFRDKAWEALSERDRSLSAQIAARRSGTQSPSRPDNWATAFGPVHGAMLFRILCAGPEHPDLAPQSGHWFTSHMRSAWPRLAVFWQQTDLRGGLAAEELDIRLSAEMEFVPSDSDTMAAWKAEIRHRKLPEIRMPDTMRGGYFPKGGPEFLHRFEAAIKERGDEHAA